MTIRQTWNATSGILSFYKYDVIEFKSYHLNIITDYNTQTLKSQTSVIVDADPTSTSHELSESAKQKYTNTSNNVQLG